jgi:DNA polymerase (family 10)
MPNKKEIIGLLENIADLLEYNNENPFKVNAFRSGANSIKRYESELDEIIKSKSLDKIKGIGKGLQAVIYEFYDTGTSKAYEELLKSAPEGINELLKIRGLGPKKIKILYTELGISNIGELEYACKENRLSLLKGFGQAAQNKIAGELQKLKAYSKFILLNKAEEISDEILGRISRFPLPAR